MVAIAPCAIRPSASPSALRKRIPFSPTSLNPVIKPAESDPKRTSRPGTPNDKRSVVMAALFALAGAYHLFGFFFPALVASSPPWRHALFVAINAAGASLMLKRPPWMIYPFAVLTAQQLYDQFTYGEKSWLALRHFARWVAAAI